MRCARGVVRSLSSFYFRRVVLVVIGKGRGVGEVREGEGGADMEGEQEEGGLTGV